MIALLIYEFKKILKMKGTRISIVVIFLVMIFSGIKSTGLFEHLGKGDKYEDPLYSYVEKVFEELPYKEYSEENYNAIHKEYMGLYDGNDTAILESKGIYGPAKKTDCYLFGYAYEQMYYMKCFKQDIDEVVLNAEQIKENNKYLGKYGNKYKEREADKMISAYSKISENVELGLFYSVGASAFARMMTEQKDKIDSQLILLFICCIFAAYFTNEYETEMNKMTYVTVKGKNAMFAYKNLVVFIITFFVTLLSLHINFICCVKYFGSMQDALSKPIQLIYDKTAFAEYCPFSITFGQYILLVFFMRFTAFYFATSIVIFFSVLVRKCIYAISFSALFLIGLLQFTMYTSQQKIDSMETISSELYNIFSKLRLFSPISLLWCEDYVNGFDVVNLLGYPVYKVIFILFFSWLLITMLYVINLLLYRRRSEIDDFRISEYFKKIWKKGNFT